MVRISCDSGPGSASQIRPRLKELVFCVQRLYHLTANKIVGGNYMFIWASDNTIRSSAKIRLPVTEFYLRRSEDLSRMPNPQRWCLLSSLARDERNDPEFLQRVALISRWVLACRLSLNIEIYF